MEREATSDRRRPSTPADRRRPPAADRWADRVRASLLLSACGDALGARFEGSATVPEAPLDRWLDHSTEPLRWTDDTAMTLVLAGHLARHQGTVDEDQLADEFAAEWAREPDRGYGPGAARVLAAILGGTAWVEAATRAFGGTGSFGNGAAMRVAPVGLIAGLGSSAIAGRARRSAAITHAHRLARDGAAVQAVAVATAAVTRQPPAAKLDAVPTTELTGPAAEFTAHVSEAAETTEFQSALRRVAEEVSHRADPARIAARLGNDVSAIGSVPAALAAFLSHPDDAPAALRFAIRIGGDTDTIAAMTGALCGARLGTAAVPASWIARLESTDRIDQLAADLAQLSTVDGNHGRVPAS